MGSEGASVYLVTGAGEGERLTEEERLAIARIRVEKDELRNVYLFHNKAVVGDRLEGGVYQFSPNAVIREGSPLVTSRGRLFGHVLVAPVKGTGDVDESAARSKLAQLSKAISVNSPKPYSLEQNMAVRKQAYGDIAAWEPQLGTHGHFVGLFKQDRETSMPLYYIVVHSDAGPVGEELVDKFIIPRLGRMTYASLLQSTEYNRAKSFSKRNAQRLLSTAAEQLGCDIMKQDDLLALIDESQFDAPPDLGVARIDTEYNHLRLLQGDTIAFYSKSSHLGSTTGHAVAFLIGPSQGLIIYSGDPSVNPLSCCGAWHNDACSGFPIGTGRLPDQREIDANRKNMNKERTMKAFIERLFSWEGRSATTPVNAHSQIYNYTDLSHKHQTIHVNNLGARYGAIRLKPVCAVIPPPVAK